MKENSKINLFVEKKEFYSPKYQWALDIIDSQNAVFWRFNETNIQNDFSDLKNKIPKVGLNAIIEISKIFTQYEMNVGNDYWSGVVKKIFKQPEIQMLATTNSYYEVVHARAYNEINKCLGLDTREFYTNYKDDQVLSERISFLESACTLPKEWNSLDVLKSLGTFLFIEGAVLYSSFAVIKSFSANGNNILKGINAAIDYSIRDEGNFHVTSTEMLFKTLLYEADLTIDEVDDLKKHIYLIAEKTFEHEEKIMDKIFSHGKINGITEHQLKIFIKYRINECLKYLNFKPLYENEKYNPIKSWFEANITTLKMTDFFHKQSSQYSRHWNKERFVW